MSPEPRAAGAAELEREERLALLRLARETISARLRGPASFAERPLPQGAFALPCGAFVTLRRRTDGRLRGCVGLMSGEGPLVDTVAQMAVAAAFSDGRFEPVRGDEVDGLHIEISVLSPPLPVRAEDVEVGRHGLLIRRGARRGVLLPQVPVEQGWDRETYLAQVCRKAGLREDAWREADVELLAFTATVFGEEDGPA